jgi:hypothetical protein
VFLKIGGGYTNGFSGLRHCWSCARRPRDQLSMRNLHPLTSSIVVARDMVPGIAGMGSPVCLRVGRRVEFSTYFRWKDRSHPHGRPQELSRRRTFPWKKRPQLPKSLSGAVPSRLVPIMIRFERPRFVDANVARLNVAEPS